MTMHLGGETKRKRRRDGVHLPHEIQPLYAKMNKTLSM
jgi:hypothetical protein